MDSSRPLLKVHQWQTKGSWQTFGRQSLISREKHCYTEDDLVHGERNYFFCQTYFQFLILLRHMLHNDVSKIPSKFLEK